MRSEGGGVAGGGGGGGGGGEGGERANDITRILHTPRHHRTHRLHTRRHHVALQRLFEAEAGEDEALKRQLKAQPLAALLGARSEVPLVEVVRNQRVRADVHNDGVVVEAKPELDV